jgi:undecaprenyl-phosphate 4-deoxy-4-formamido-L-arabinose transferase
MLAYPTTYPYIRGLMLLCSTNPTDVWVEHRPRPGGGTSYSLGKLVTFVLRIIFNYSTLPARVVVGCGVGLTILGGLAGVLMMTGRLGSSGDSKTLLWFLIGVALLEGVTLIAVGIVAEYVVALNRQGRPAYLVGQVLRPAPIEADGRAPARR